MSGMGREAFEAFDRLLNVPEGERLAVLERDSSLTVEVRSQVRSLLERDTPTGEFLGAPVEQATAELLSSMDTEPLPKMIGPYRVVRELGRGGFGTVYLAEQRSTKRLVAVKVPNRGVSKDDYARLRFEAEALARLSHPNIAAVHELGQHAGRPYLVTEHVEGVPINEFVQSRWLGVETVLDLLAEVCDGVDHAHRRGVLHRDLAPKNILVGGVTGDAEHATPKIIDFGLACEAEARAERQRLTLPGTMLGTMRYASPEQLAGDQRAVDTRSDLYSLGVISYELITGRHPLLEGHEPLALAVEQLTNARPVRPSGLVEGFQGNARDLDAVLLKAIQREPASRYDSVSDLARDLRSLRAGQPVEARSASTWDRTRRFVRRNRVVVTASALAGLVGAVAIGSHIRTLVREAEARDQAVQALDIVVTELISPLGEKVGTFDAREALLNRIAGNVEAVAARSPGDPEALQLLAKFLVAQGDLHRERSRKELARDTFTRAVGVYDQLWELSGHSLPVGHARSIAIVKLGDAEMHRGQHDRGIARYEQAKAFDEQLVAAHPEDTGALSNLFWSHLRHSGLPKRTSEQQVSAIKAASRVAARMVKVDPNDWRTLEAAVRAKMLEFLLLGDSPIDVRLAFVTETIPHAERLVEAQPGVVAHLATLRELTDSCVLYSVRTERWDQAEAYMKRLEAITAQLAENAADEYTRTRMVSPIDEVRSMIAFEQGRFEDAIRHINKRIPVLEMMIRSEEVVSDTPQYLIGAYGRRGRALAILGRSDEALADADRMEQLLIQVRALGLPPEVEGEIVATYTTVHEDIRSIVAKQRR